MCAEATVTASQPTVQTTDWQSERSPHKETKHNDDDDDDGGVFSSLVRTGGGGVWMIHSPAALFKVEIS